MVTLFFWLSILKASITHIIYLFTVWCRVQSKNLHIQNMNHPSDHRKNPAGPAGVSRPALRSVISVGWGKLHFELFRRRKWFWSSLLLNSKEEVISNGAEGMELNLGKFRIFIFIPEMFGMKSKHTTSKDLPLWMQPEDERLVQQNASFTELMWAVTHHEQRRGGKAACGRFQEK